MVPSWVSKDESLSLYRGDCRVILPEFEAGTFTACVTDPPYHLTAGKKGGSGPASENLNSPAGRSRITTGGFMGKAWDGGDVAFRPETWAEVLRVLKPGAHLLAFGGTRTYHRICCAIEDAGFEIRDCILWIYGSGFPKSLDVSKAIDKSGAVDTRAFKEFLRAEVERSGLGRKEIDERCGFTMRFDTPYQDDPRCWGVSLPSPEKWAKICGVLGLQSSRWQELIDRVWRGRSGEQSSENTCLSGPNFDRTDKCEPSTEAAKLWSGYGTALKPAYEPIIVARKPLAGTVVENCLTHGCGALNIDACRIDGFVTTNPLVRNAGGYSGGLDHQANPPTSKESYGRFPANLIHDGSEEVLAGFPQTSSGTGAIKGGSGTGYTPNAFGKESRPAGTPNIEYGDNGSAARFFYCAKASKSDRGDGNTHPTVKPLALMEYLVKLVKMPGDNHILDPFAGSGTTLLACYNNFCRASGIDLEADHADIAETRAKKEAKKTPLFP